MKRARDDVYATESQFKRPFGSARGESYEESHIPSRGVEGTGGSGGEGRGGGGSSQKLTTTDALSYLKEVKEMFHDRRDKYDMFLEVMKDFKAQRTDTAGVIARVKELFKGHNNLIYGFNTFLPKGYEITLAEVEAPAKKTVEFEEAISFVNKIKRRFENDDHVYKSFLDILNMYRKENKDINEVYNEVSALFEDHLDLLEEFTRFLPESLPAHSAQKARFGKYHTQRRNEGVSGALPVCQIQKERRRDRPVGSRGDQDYRVERSERNDDKVEWKNQRDQKKHVDKEKREWRNRNLDDRETELDNLQHFHDRRKSSRKSEVFEGYSSPASYAEKDNLKSMYNQAFAFCEKVKERLCCQDDYQTFLKCLNIFSSGIIQRKDLQNLVSDLLGKYPDLMDEFNQFFERCESIDGCQLLAGVMSKKSLDEVVPRSVKMEDKERDQKREIEAAKEKERINEKYMEKSIQELDLSDCDRCTPSYRLLPHDYPILTVSQRSDVGAGVLNDHWVSVTSGSEDYSFKHMRRNQYEESLFRCEDDRFELDLLLESVSSTAKHAEDLLNSINHSKFNSDVSIRIEEHFSALELRCMERLYGDHGLDVMDLLRKKPAAGLPVILTRLKQKQEEWTKCRKDFNKVWADVYAKNHYKSLDHRSFYFKQQDVRNLSTKSLVAEIKDLKDKMQNEDDILLSISSSHKQSFIPHLEYEYLDKSIHEDLYKLVHFSCEEICSTKEQLNKALRLWTNFLEPMIGVSPCSDGAEVVDDMKKTKSPDANWSASSNREANLKPAATGDEYASSGVSMVAGNGLIDRESAGKKSMINIDSASRADSIHTIHKTKKDREKLNGTEKWCEGGALITINDGGNGSLPIGVENGFEGTGSADVKDSLGTQPSSNDNNRGDHRPTDSLDNGPSIQDQEIPSSVLLVNGVPSEAEGDTLKEKSVASLKIEKEEGELSPNGEFEEDNFGVCGDPDVKQTAKPEQSIYTEREHNVDADDEDSENDSEAGEDISVTESAADECSQEENGGEDPEHDEGDGKTESEGEANALLIGPDGMSMPLSERVLLSTKPLAKHVPTVPFDEKTKDYRVFYANDDFFVLFKLHQILYDRILFAKKSSTNGEMKRRNLKDSSSPDPYARFMSALYSLLDGSAENAKFEDECRAIIGNQSYILFTLDKLIYKLVKQLQAVATDDTDNRLLQLYEYERSRKPGSLIDSVYYENARVLLHEENIYRLKCRSSPSYLSVQLMDNMIEKPEAFAVSMEPSFASYLQNEFLSVSTGREEREDHLLRRNKKKYAVLDDFAATCKAMENVKMINGLECKISCSSCKISYVLDTEDIFHRRNRRKSSKDRSRYHGERLERFHRFLSRSR